jgi:hypothetical protein
MTKDRGLASVQLLIRSTPQSSRGTCIVLRSCRDGRRSFRRIAGWRSSVAYRSRRTLASVACWSMTADGLTFALEDYQRAQDELVEARNRLARAIAGAAMSGATKDEIVELTGYTADRVLRICRDAGISEAGRAVEAGCLD